LSLEDELLLLARERERISEGNLADMWLDQPHKLRLQLRHDLNTQADRNKLRRSGDAPYLITVAGGLQEIVCPEVGFLSEARLDFKIQLTEHQKGWLVRHFQFHLRLPPSRNIKMVRIHLNEQAGFDPLRIPRCHLHVGDSAAHVPFPVMEPRLLVHLSAGILSLISVWTHSSEIEKAAGIPAAF
jgi:hypothetical protein